MRVWLTNCAHRYRVPVGRSVKAGQEVVCSTCGSVTLLQDQFGTPLPKRYQDRHDTPADVLLF